MFKQCQLIILSFVCDNREGKMAERQREEVC